jgi:hypothetical protein
MAETVLGGVVDAVFGTRILAESSVMPEVT